MWSRSRMIAILTADGHNYGSYYRDNNTHQEKHKKEFTNCISSWTPAGIEFCTYSKKISDFSPVKPWICWIKNLTKSFKHKTLDIFRNERTRKNQEYKNPVVMFIYVVDFNESTYFYTLPDFTEIYEVKKEVWTILDH